MAAINRKTDQLGNNLVINQIEQDDEYAPFGVNDEDVQLKWEVSQVGGGTTWQPWGTLRNFFKEWLIFKEAWSDFLANSKHIQYGNVTPTNSNVKVWFDTSSEQEQQNG